MTKEKAKRYDEALEIAKKNYITTQDLCEGSQIGVECFKNTLESIFPELKENEDERMWKLIKKYVHYNISDMTLNADHITREQLESWLEKQGKKELVNFDEAEKEKTDFVGDGFIECHADFLDFKEGNTYWLEYIGDDKYNVRSDNLLGKTYHITPCQLYTVFKKLTWLEKQGEKPQGKSALEAIKEEKVDNQNCGKQFTKDDVKKIVQLEEPYLYNCLLRDFEEIETSIDPRKDIEQFINYNYNISHGFRISKEPNKGGKYEVDGWGIVKVICLNITSLTNGLFEWKNVDGNFSCSYCRSLTSLEGAPKKVSGGFYCQDCDSLMSLEGAPKEVGMGFYCLYCHSLTSLKGAPEEVGMDFNCSYCYSLTSLKGAPKYVGGNFSCRDCKKLISLKGSPKKVNKNFDCSYCDSLETLEGCPEEVGGLMLS